MIFLLEKVYMLKLTISTLITILIIYLVYLEVTEREMPNVFHDLMEEQLFRIGLLIAIPVVALIGKKINLTLPILIAVVYLLLNNLYNRDSHAERFMNTFFGENNAVPLGNFADAGGVENFANNAITTSLTTNIKPSCGCN
jgi:hypothetical protein